MKMKKRSEAEGNKQNNAYRLVYSLEINLESVFSLLLFQRIFHYKYTQKKKQKIECSLQFYIEKEHIACRYVRCSHVYAYEYFMHVSVNEYAGVVFAYWYIR